MDGVNDNLDSNILDIIQFNNSTKWAESGIELNDKIVFEVSNGQLDLKIIYSADVMFLKTFTGSFHLNLYYPGVTYTTSEGTPAPLASFDQAVTTGAQVHVYLEEPNGLRTSGINLIVVDGD